MKALRDLRDVVLGCLGKTLNPNYYDHIKKFSQSFRDLGLNTLSTLKVHIAEHHVEEFIVIKGGKFCKCIFKKTTKSNEKTKDNFLKCIYKNISLKHFELRCRVLD